MKSPQAIIHLSSSSHNSVLFYGLAIRCLTSATVSASYGGNETNYLALLSFKSKITLDPYKVLTSWNHSFRFCDWSGISCGKRHKRVIALRLGSQGLEGSLSPHVGNLSFLRELYLRNNSFQGTIPHELGRLSRLRYLYLNRNKFSGVIPTNLSGCSNLEEPYLNLNELTGSIPKEMSLLSKLTSLVIYENKLTGGIPPFLGNITSMEVFAVERNPLGGSIPDTLGHWKSLTEFDSGGCNLYGSIPQSLFNLSLLVNISLAVNHLTGSLPSEIGNQLPNLEYLQLWGNELTGVLPPFHLLLFKQKQESARKDVERAFAVLQGHWHIISQPARAWTINKLRRVMYTCIILHNMILKDQKFAISEMNDIYVCPRANIQRTWIERCDVQRKNAKELRDKATHARLQRNIIEHVWQLHQQQQY